MDRDGTGAPLLGEVLPVELMNTVWADRDGVHDALGTTAQALAWLQAVRDRLAPQPPAVDDWLLDPRPAADDTAGRLRVLRDALRDLAAAGARPVGPSAGPDRDAALAVLGDACAAAPTWSSLEWTDGGARRVLHGTAAPGRIVVARLAEDGVALFAGADGTRLRSCPAPGCVLHFVKRHPRQQWCSAGCGNRARVARHYRRHRTPSTGPA